MQLQLKHLPILFVAMAALCLTGAIAASLRPTPQDSAAIAQG